MKILDKIKKLIYKRDKDHILRDSDFKAEENIYYADISAKFSNAQMILYLILLVFVALSLLIYSDTITYKNLYYFAKDFNTAMDVADANADSISYSADPSQSFVVYKGGIAIAGNAELSIMTASGRVTHSQNLGFSTPQIVSSKKYVLTYDLDGKNVYLCNSFSELFTESFDNKVTDAALSDSGVFAVATASSESKSEIYLYNSAFNLINFIRTNQYIIDMSLSSDGKHLAVISAISNSEGYSSRLRVYEVGKENIERELVYGELFPLGCEYTENGVLNVLFDKAFVSYDKSGRAVSDTDLSAKTVETFYMSTEGAVIVFGDKSETLKNHILVFDNKGKMVYNKDTDLDVSSVALLGDYVFVRTPSSVMRSNIYGDSVKEVAFDRSDAKMVVYSESSVVMCSSSKAWFVDF